MSVQYAVFLCHDFLRAVLDVFDRLPAPAATLFFVAVGIGLYESLGNKRLAPGKWR